MTKYRFYRSAGGTITVRAERKIGKQLIISTGRVIAPGEDISAAMRSLYKEVHDAGVAPPTAESRAGVPRVGE